MRCLVVQTKRLGDVIFSSTLCQSIKKSWPTYQVDYLVEAPYVAAVENHPYIDNIIVLNSAHKNSKRQLLLFLMHIRQRNYDLIINVQGQIIGLLVSLFSGARKRVGFGGFPWRLGSNILVDYISGSCDQGNGCVVDDRFQLIQPLSPTIEDRQYRIYIDDEARHRGRQQLMQASALHHPVTGFVALGINAAKRYKCWPLSAYAQLATWLVREFRVYIWVYVGPNEQEYNTSLKTLLPDDVAAHIIDSIQTSDIRQLIENISAVDLFVGNDTGPRVICQALNIPTFGIASPRSDVSVWNPSHHHRFRAISVNDVLHLPQKQWQTICQTVSDTEQDNRPWLEKITPEHVQTRLKRMIVDLNLFSKPRVNTEKSVVV